jgi:hypothetical protein
MKIETENFTLLLDGQRGMFEHRETGCGGGVWFEYNVLMDYDGVFQLPKEVIDTLRDNGFIVDEDFE